MEIFISYAKEDETLLEELVNRLKQSGVRVQRDNSVLRLGDDWREAIFSAIKRSDAFVLLWSSHSAKSRHVMEEIMEALKHSKQIMPCLLDDTEITPLLREIHHLKLSNLDDQYDELLSHFSLDIERSSALISQDIKSAIATYKSIIKAKFNHLQVLFFGKEKAVDQVYVELTLNNGLEADRLKGEISSTKLFDYVQTPGSKFLVAGHPGTGKTSTLHYLMYRWGNSESTFLIVYARLKDFEPRLHSSFSDFIFDQLHSLQIGNIEQLFEQANIFENYKCLVLLDGLDEVPAGNYPILSQHFNNFIEQHRHCSFIVTTRVDGFRDKREEDFLGWDIFSIARLDHIKIKEFISLWFNDSKRESELLDKLRDPRLSELAGRAFLLALICLVFEEEGRLGENRSALYEQASLYLEKTRSGKLTAKIIEARRDVLKEIALLYLQLNRKDIDQNILLVIVSKILPNENPKAFLEELSNDTGLLQNYGGTYVFIHKSFQEYYSALALKDRAYGRDLLLDYCQVSQWEEPIRLYAGSIRNRSEQETLITSLWRKNPALALRTATECHQLAPNFLGTLIKSTSPENRLRMIGEIQASLRTIDIDDARRITIETLKPLFSCEKDASVLYFGIQLLREFDPDDSGNVMYHNFYKLADSLYELLSSDSKYKFEFVEVIAGSFIMGDNSSQDKHEQPAHRVYVDEFKMCKYQLTNLAYETIMGLEHSKREATISDEDDQPVININWYDAYICALKVGCRLPSEAEWEYAARAGSTTNWCFGDDKDQLVQYANYEDSNLRSTRRVGLGLPNKWGFYDVHGNVWEWCQDWFAPYTDSFQKNPCGPATGTARVRRGGGHAYHARGCRSAFRWGNDPTYKFKDIGMRLSKDIQ